MIYKFFSFLFFASAHIAHALPPANEHLNIPSLKKLAAAKGIAIGTAIDESAYIHDEKYSESLKYHFNMVTPEYSTMMDAIQFFPKEVTFNNFNFSNADRILDFARNNKILVRGHALQWYFSNPKWLTWRLYSPSELEEILQTHVTTVVKHFKDNYPGVLTNWVVINEAVDEKGQPRRGIWSQIGNQPWDYIVKAFNWAHGADPTLKLFYNDFDMEKGGAKADSVFALVKAMKEHQVPIHGIGYQMHVDVDTPFDPNELERQFKEYAALGLNIHITELDVRIKTDDGVTSEELARQAKIYADTFRVCLKVSACTNVTFWGFTDRYSWVNSDLFFPGYGSATILTEDFQPKPAFDMLIKVLQQ